MAKRRKQKNARRDKVMDHVRAQRGLDREDFFANGGEMVRWRGLHLVQQDKKKKKNKKACRGRYRGGEG